MSDLSRDSDGEWIPEPPAFVTNPSPVACKHLDWSTYDLYGHEYPLCVGCGRIEGMPRVIARRKKIACVLRPTRRERWWTRIWRTLVGGVA
jgi:hypothetical protein